MNEQINFGFLRECIQALKEFPSTHFTMGHLFYKDPDDGNVCGTPACVLGHWAAWQMSSGRITHLRHPVDAAMHVLRYPGEYGLTEEQKNELFEIRGCANAQTKDAAIAYIENFIVRHGGQLSGSLAQQLAAPKLESTSSGWLVRTPDWQQIVQQPAAEAVLS